MTAYVEGFCAVAGHRPAWETYTCCEGHPVVAVCAVCGQTWPCDSARSVVEVLRSLAEEFPDTIRVADLRARADEIEAGHLAVGP